jgi:hypothetical protein
MLTTKLNNKLAQFSLIIHPITGKITFVMNVILNYDFKRYQKRIDVYSWCKIIKETR